MERQSHSGGYVSQRLSQSPSDGIRQKVGREGSMGKAGDKVVASHGMHSVCVCLLVDTLDLG